MSSPSSRASQSQNLKQFEEQFVCPIDFLARYIDVEFGGLSLN